jgi:hypothetical protein
MLNLYGSAAMPCKTPKVIVPASTFTRTGQQRHEILDSDARSHLYSKGGPHGRDNQR